MAGPIEILSVFALAILLFYYYLTSTFNHWKARGIVGPQPIPIFGNLKDVVQKKVSIGDYLKELYDEYKNEPVIGIFAWRTPQLVIVDPDLIKDVLVSDFSKFSDRGTDIAYKAEPLQINVFNLPPIPWRSVRMRLAPAFSYGKIKEMFKLILECSKYLEEDLGKLVAKGEPIDCIDLSLRYTSSVIGSCVFGLDMSPKSEGKKDFNKVARHMNKSSLGTALRFMLKLYASRLYNILGYVIPQEMYTKFFTDLTRNVMKHRRENNIVRQDVIDTFINIQKHPEKITGIEVTDNFFAAQAFVLFLAGFHTTASTISNALYELALNPGIQDKLRKEIIEMHSKVGADPSVEDVKELPYLDKVFNETLRKYSVTTDLTRRTTSSYTFQKIGLTIPKGFIVRIPLYAIHRDPDVYPEPEVFKPERFDEENVATRHPMHFMPFGNGPRNCMGAKFAVYQVKIALIKILRNYKVERCKETAVPYVNDPLTFLLSPKDGIVLKFVKTDKV